MSTKDTPNKKPEIRFKEANLAFLDLETTGMDPKHHEIIEIGVVIARQVKREGRGPSLELIDELDIKVKPTHIETAQPVALKINKYRQEDWLFAVPLETALLELNKKAKGAVLIAQNITFDWGFLEAAYQKTRLPFGLHPKRKLDTIALAFALLYDDPNMQKFSLHHLCQRYGVENRRAHTALSDARAIFGIYKKMFDA